MFESRRPAALLTSLLTAGALGLSGFGLSGLATAAPAPAPVAGVAEGAVTQAAPAARAGARKGLRVRVMKPKAMRKQVRVTVTGPRQNGKKFRRVIRATRWWPKVKPGVYRIKANTFRKYEQRVVPTVNVTKVRIPRSRKFREVKVTYTNPRFCTGPGYSVKAWGDNNRGQVGLRPITGPGADEGLLPQLMHSGDYNPPGVALGAGQLNGYMLFNPSDFSR